jgi:hypothetical protein
MQTVSKRLLNVHPDMPLIHPVCGTLSTPASWLHSFGAASALMRMLLPASTSFTSSLSACSRGYP